MAEREIKRWVTWHGRRIPIYEGESKADVAARIKGGLKEGAKKGRDTQEKQHAANVKSKKEALDKARKKSNEKGRKWADNPTERRKQSYQKAVDDAQKASKDFSDAYDGKVKAKFHKKSESDHDKAVEFFAKKEGISKEKAANMVKNMNPETVKRLMAKGDMKKSEYKSEPSKFNVEDYKKKVASDSDFYAKVAGIKSKKMVDKEKAEKKGSKVEDVGHGLRRFQTADGRTLYKDKSGHWVKKADAEARLKGSDGSKKEPKDVMEAAKMMREGDGTVTTKDKKIINAYKSNGSYGVVDNADGSSTIMSKNSDAWKKHTGASSSDKKAEKEATKIDGATTISKKDFIDKYAEEYGMDADDFKQKGKDIKNFIIPEDDENPYIGVEYSDGTFWRYGTGRDLEVSKKELEEYVGKSTQQDKDERVKQKQIATANKQKDALNNKKAKDEIGKEAFNKWWSDLPDEEKIKELRSIDKEEMTVREKAELKRLEAKAAKKELAQKKGSEENFSFQKDKKVKAPKFKPKTRDEIRKLPKEERHSYMTDASDKAFKETLKELGIKESELHLMPGYQKDKFRDTLERKLDDYNADLSWDSADSKLGYHLAGNSGAIAWAYAQQTDKKNWQEVKMTPSQIKEHLRKTKGAKVYEEYNRGVIPYDTESLLKQKFGSSFSHHGIGSQSSVVENSVKLYRDKKGNLKLAKHSLTWD